MIKKAPLGKRVDALSAHVIPTEYRFNIHSNTWRMNTFLLSLERILLRDLDRLEKEINHYPTEESLWKIKGDIKNSAGTLCLHLCGNLQHYIGVGLGGSSYLRNREKEFSARNIGRKNLLGEIQAAKQTVATTLKKLDASILETEYPLLVFDEPVTTQYFMIHLAAHLEYHLGQVNYHRRLIQPTS